MKQTLKLISACAAVAAMGSANAGLVIDDFGSASQLISSPPAVTNAAFGTTTTGYVRTLTTTNSGAVLDIAVNGPTTAGQFSQSQGAGVKGTSAVNYALSGTGGIDLTQGGTSNAFRLDLVTVDLQMLLGIEVFDGTNTAQLMQNSSTLQVANLVANGIFLPLSVDYLFSSFAGIDFTSVDSIKLLVDGTLQVSTDATLDNLGVVCSANTGSGLSTGNGQCSQRVPEPDALALVGIAMLGLTLMRRKAVKA